MACLSETVDGQSMILCSALTVTEPVEVARVENKVAGQCDRFSWRVGNSGPLAMNSSNSLHFPQIGP
jgi:hypothetical protein